MSTVSPKTPGLISIRAIVMSVLNRLQDYSLKRYKALTQIAIEGFSELNLWTMSGHETVYLRMSLAKTVELPVDYVDYLKIGVPINGKLRVITRNDSILLPRTFEDGTSVGNTDSGDESKLDNVVFFSSHFKNGVFVGGLYGLPGGIDTNYFRIDEENRQIVFAGDIGRGEIVLEYLSSGVKTDGSSMVPREAIPALRTYVLWQMIENDQKVAYNAKDRAKREHEEAVSMLVSFQSIFSKEDYLRMLYGSYTQSPRR